MTQPIDRRPVVVYDGECPFCRRQVAAIQRRDKHGVYEYAPKQTPGLLDRFPQLRDEEFGSGIRLVGLDGAARTRCTTSGGVCRSPAGSRGSTTRRAFIGYPTARTVGSPRTASV
ncbi:MAG: DCC1-like thiol-disulfide oxidoreductase family protein [Candidatus Poribacteria bacterium]|nr:DCC1-like thiol-disulfide oxidoreductase family protein [Candidatus Poribacteria bacterium]